ncbi:MAG: hypothetical protein L6R37_002990 [Teloschistes peruensis]|nr:MAG: hypothetical protein L6R37_002990 [Teloschistes peruensis]
MSSKHEDNTPIGSYCGADGQCHCTYPSLAGMSSKTPVHTTKSCHNEYCAPGCALGGGHKGYCGDDD